MQAALLVDDLAKSSEPQGSMQVNCINLQKPLPPLPDDSDEKPARPSRKARMGKFVCGLGEKGFRNAANVLHRKKVRVVEVGEVSDTVEDAQVIHDSCRFEPQPLITKHLQEGMSTRPHNSIEGKMGRVAKILHIGDTTKLFRGRDIEGKNERDSLLKAFLKWVLAKFEQLTHKSAAPGPQPVETMADLQAKMAQIVQLNTEHSIDYPEHHDYVDRSRNKKDELIINDIWARIVHALENDNNMPAEIESQSKVITKRIIRSMKEDPKWAKMAARVAMKAPQSPSTVTKTDARSARNSKDAILDASGKVALGTAKKLPEMAYDGTSLVTKLDAGKVVGSAAGILPSDQQGAMAVNSDIDSLVQPQTNGETQIPSSSRSLTVQPQSSIDPDAKALPTFLNAEKVKAIPRNKACPCGSHRKYKKCCGKDAESNESLSPSIHPSILKDATNHKHNTDV